MIPSLDRNFWLGLFTSLQPVLVLGACFCVDSSADRTAAGATLQELFDGGSLIVGDARFSNWELNSLSSTAGSPNLTQITAVPLLNDLANPGLLFAANGQLAVSGVNSIDLMFTYRVQTLSSDAAFANHALALTGVNFGGDGGLAFVADDLRDDSGGDFEPTLVIDDKATNFVLRHDRSEFAPQSAMSVTTSVFVGGLSATDAVHLASFTQRFSRTGLAFASSDFDEDGDVDAADLAIWKVGFGATGDVTHRQGDADGDHDVDGADLLIWQRQLTAGLPVAEAAAAVPEPRGFLLMALAAFGNCRRVGPARKSHQQTG
jgi:hypothetical protein